LESRVQLGTVRTLLSLGSRQDESSVRVLLEVSPLLCDAVSHDLHHLNAAHLGHVQIYYGYLVRIFAACLELYRHLIKGLQAIESLNHIL